MPNITEAFKKGFTQKEKAFKKGFTQKEKAGILYMTIIDYL